MKRLLAVMTLTILVITTLFAEDSSKTNLELVGSVNCSFSNNSSKGSKVKVSDDLAAVMHNMVGVKLFNLSDKTNPYEVGSYGYGEKIIDIELIKNHLYVLVDAGRLKVIDVSDPSAPFQVSTHQNSSGVKVICFS